MKKEKISFIKWGLNGKTYSIVMMIGDGDGDGFEIAVSNYSTPKIETFEKYLSRSGYVKATKQEFIEMYNKINEMINNQLMMNL